MTLHNMDPAAPSFLQMSLVIGLVIVIALLAQWSSTNNGNDDVFYTMPAHDPGENPLSGQATFGTGLSILVGDLNHDGIIDIDDKNLLITVIGQEKSLAAKNRLLADLDLDTKITNHDAKVLSDYLNGKIGQLPVIMGDLDSDGFTRPADALILSEFLEGGGSFSLDQMYLGDMDENGVINEQDKDLLLAAIR